MLGRGHPPWLSSLVSMITYLGDGGHLTWRSEPVPSGKGGHWGFQEGLCPFTLVLSLWNAVLGLAAG